MVYFFELLIVLIHPTYDQTKHGGSLKSVQLLAGAIPDNGPILEPICLEVPVGLLHLLLLGQDRLRGCTKASIFQWIGEVKYGKMASGRMHDDKKEFDSWF